ncbi:(deoxy)nucleoside triphosphate pyrophosphohydrolase [Candidatus Binatia bacterium]|jgi:8-oxo-dGTP diphosphatase|nr:(deoxy)nucleoside triphosphate pyrophosphohydrolase [Candidatus Binatia bacterium]
MPPPSSEGARAVEVAAGLLLDGELVLVCQRSAAGSHPLRWEFPGGKLESGESAEACLERELREELGIVAQIGEHLASVEHRYDDGPHVRVHFYAIASHAGTIENRVFERIVWHPRARLDELDFLDADRPLIVLLRRRAQLDLAAARSILER